MRIGTRALLAMCMFPEFLSLSVLQLTCRRPAHAYTFAFEPNPDWSTFYAYGPEIKKYMQGFGDKYDLSPFIKLNSKVLKAVWKEEQGICMYLETIRPLREHTLIPYA